MRVLVISLVLVAGCESAPLGHRTDAGGADAGMRADATAPDGSGSPDSASADAAADTFAPDTGHAPDAAATPDVGRDTPAACTPTRTSCNAGGLECGVLSNGCPGGTFDCGPCGGGIDTCEILAPMFQTRTYNCTQMVQASNDSWFDPVMFRDTSSWLVLDAHANDYVSAVAACVNGGGRLAIVDPGAPGNEIRVRPDAGGGAENFIVRTYGTGRTAGRYTSTCSPPGF